MGQGGVGGHTHAIGPIGLGAHRLLGVGGGLTGWPAGMA